MPTKQKAHEEKRVSNCLCKKTGGQNLSQIKTKSLQFQEPEDPYSMHNLFHIVRSWKYFLTCLRKLWHPEKVCMMAFNLRSTIATGCERDLHWMRSRRPPGWTLENVFFFHSWKALNCGICLCLKWSKVGQ